MEVLSQIISGIGSLLSSITGNMPNEEKIDKNIELLKADPWFLEIYNTNHEFISTDQNIRYIIGNAKINKILHKPKKILEFQKAIEEALPSK